MKYRKTATLILFLILIFSLVCISENKSALENLKILNNESEHMIENVPFHYQIKDYYCSPACLEMVFDYYGPDINQTEIAEVAETTEIGTIEKYKIRAALFSNYSDSNGTEIPGSINGYTARKFGYAAFAGNFYLSDLKNFINQDKPIIVSMSYNFSHSYKFHSRVVIGYNDTHIFTLDPLSGMVNFSNNDFLKLWYWRGINLGVYISPWIIQIEKTVFIHSKKDFELTATITFPEKQQWWWNNYSAFNSSATIILPEELRLSDEENATKPLPVMENGDEIQVSWYLRSEYPGEFNITIMAEGIVDGPKFENYTHTPIEYQDRIGGKSDLQIKLVERDLMNTLILIITPIIAIAAISVFYIMRKKKPPIRT